MEEMLIAERFVHTKAEKREYGFIVGCKFSGRFLENALLAWHKRALFF